MFEYKIVTEYKYMKRSVKIDNPTSQRIGKLDVDDLLASSFPTELHAIGAEGFAKIKRGEKVVITIRKTETIYLSPIIKTGKF